MAVYTQVSDEALAEFLSAYDLGAPVAFKGIAEGVENSNYYLGTEKGRFILTLFEKRVKADDLPFFIGLKQHLAAKGYPCPEPVMARDGKASLSIRNAAGRTSADTAAQRIHARLVAGHARKQPTRRPSTVSIHHDGHVTGNQRCVRHLHRLRLGSHHGGHTAMMSCSLEATS